MIIFNRYKILYLLFIFFIGISGFAQIPNGYYDGTENLTGTQLQARLHTIIGDHYSISYSEIWQTCQVTDKKSNGKVWDMYSDVPNGTPPYSFTFVSDQCGTYSSEGDCYNREHSFPQSWFNEQSPMKTDIFHIYPTDGYVNGRRSNHPMGNVGSASWTSQNGSKVGSCSNSGYSGTVFEPIDEYKGDFARTFFYMAVRYYNEDNGWQNSDMTNGSQLKSWAMKVMQQWHLDDPVSQKEINRNNAVYSIQGNRNPFIDCPSFVGKIWEGPASTHPIYDDCFPAPEICNAPTNVSTITNGNNITISWETVSSAISYSIFVNNSLLDDGITTNDYTDTNLPNGTYCYKVVSVCDNDVSDYSNESCETIILSIVEQKSTIEIYPNPVINILNIKTYENCNIVLYDIVGNQLINQFINQSGTINLEYLQKGIYILKIQSINNEFINTYKIVK